MVNVCQLADHHQCWNMSLTGTTNWQVLTCRWNMNMRQMPRHSDMLISLFQYVTTNRTAKETDQKLVSIPAENENLNKNEHGHFLR